MERFKDILEIITQFITIFGVPVGIWVYYKNKEKEVYNSLDDKYIDFLKLCIDHPELKISIKEMEIGDKLTEGQKYQRQLVYEVLLSLFERAYLLYKDQSNKIKRRQYKGWEGYKNDWMKNKSFREAWKILGSQYDESFVESMDSIYTKHNG